MTTRPYELLARFSSNGTVAGVSVRTITTVNGRDYESDPTPLADTEDQAFVDFADAFSASVVAERDSLTTQVATLTQERDTAIGVRESLETQVAALQAELDELKNPPVQASVTPYQIRRWMLEQGIALESVTTYINAIEDTLERELARVQWEWGSSVYRDNELLIAFATQLGMTDDQIDAAFAYAATLT